MSRRGFFGVAGSAGAAAFLAACGSSGSASPTSAGTNSSVTATPTRGGTLNIGYTAEPRGGFEPHTGFGADDLYWDYLVFDQLIGYDQDGKLDATRSLAEKWEVPDQTTINLTLRQGITFHDGSPFDAETVKWNLDRILNPATKATPAPDVASIASVSAPSPTSVVIKLKSPDATILYAFGDVAGMVISRAKFEKIGLDAFRRDPAGTGAYTLKSWTAAANMLLTRNPNYWRKDAQGGVLPYLDNIKVQFIPEDTVRTAALESGQIDLLSQTPAIDAKRLSQDGSYGTATFVGPTTGLFYINHTLAPFDNQSFRQAFASALDVPNYVNNFLTGAEPAAGGVLTPHSWAYDPSVKPYTYDPQKAQQLLAQSGIPEANRVIKMQIQGQSLTQGEEFWQASLLKAGIKVEWMPGMVGGARAHLFKGQGGDGTAAGVASSWAMRVDPHGTMGQIYTQTGPYNASQAAMPDIEPLVAQAKATYVQDDRKQLYSKIQTIARDKLYSVVPTYYSIFYSHASKKVQNFDALYGGEGKPRFANLWVK